LKVNVEDMYCRKKKLALNDWVLLQAGNSLLCPPPTAAE